MQVADVDDSAEFWSNFSDRSDSKFIGHLRDFINSQAQPVSTSDFPLSLFYDELLVAFPDALFVLTTRHVGSWWESARRQMPGPARAPHNIRNRFAAYTEGQAHHHMFPKRFVQHYKDVLQSVPCCQLLLMDITAGEGFERLSPFLGHPVPEDHRFPTRRVTAQRAEVYAARLKAKEQQSKQDELAAQKKIGKRAVMYG